MNPNLPTIDVIVRKLTENSFLVVESNPCKQEHNLDYEQTIEHLGRLYQDYNPKIDFQFSMPLEECYDLWYQAKQWSEIFLIGY